MKKLLDNFYIISKLSFTLLLLACLIIALYVLLINYQKENKLSSIKSFGSANVAITTFFCEDSKWFAAIFAVRVVLPTPDNPFTKVTRSAKF